MEIFSLRRRRAARSLVADLDRCHVSFRLRKCQDLANTITPHGVSSLAVVVITSVWLNVFVTVTNINNNNNKILKVNISLLKICQRLVLKTTGV